MTIDFDLCVKQLLLVLVFCGEVEVIDSTLSFSRQRVHGWYGLDVNQVLNTEHILLHLVSRKEALVRLMLVVSDFVRSYFLLRLLVLLRKCLLLKTHLLLRVVKDRRFLILLALVEEVVHIC